LGCSPTNLVGGKGRRWGGEDKKSKSFSERGVLFVANAKQKGGG